MLLPPAPWTESGAGSGSGSASDQASDMDARPAVLPRGGMAEAAERSGGEASPSGAMPRNYGEASFRCAPCPNTCIVLLLVHAFFTSAS